MPGIHGIRYQDSTAYDTSFPWYMIPVSRLLTVIPAHYPTYRAYSPFFYPDVTFEIASLQNLCVMSKKLIEMVVVRKLILLLQRGLSERNIAKELGISRATVRRYLRKQ